MCRTFEIGSLETDHASVKPYGPSDAATGIGAQARGKRDGLPQPDLALHDRT
jgi:hypothetical protein